MSVAFKGFTDICALKIIHHKALPTNRFNYDESNLTDYLAHKKVIIKKDVTQPERTLNTSKTSISLIYCGAAEQQFLPPYVVYKAIKPMRYQLRHMVQRRT